MPDRVMAHDDSIQYVPGTRGEFLPLRRRAKRGRFGLSAFGEEAPTVTVPTEAGSLITPVPVEPPPAPLVGPDKPPVVDQGTIQRVAADVVQNNPAMPPEQQKVVALAAVNKLLEAQQPYVQTGQKVIATATVFTGILAILGKVGEKTKSVFLKVKGAK